MLAEAEAGWVVVQLSSTAAILLFPSTAYGVFSCVSVASALLFVDVISWSDAAGVCFPSNVVTAFAVESVPQVSPIVSPQVTSPCALIIFSSLLLVMSLCETRDCVSSATFVALSSSEGSLLAPRSPIFTNKFMLDLLASKLEAKHSLQRLCSRVKGGEEKDGKVCPPLFRDGMKKYKICKYVYTIFTARPELENG